ncbi:MAG: ARPP-1 family domain-containing protein [Planctomycetota bacterium]
MVSISGSKLWEGMKAAEPCVHGSVRIVPLVGPSSDDPAYRLFDADTAEKVEVTEVDEGGHVPNIMVDNGLDDRLLLIDGQELIGAKQNRILNTDVLIAAHKKINIPVSCVEAGRWGYRSRKFRPGGHSPSSSRGRKAVKIREALAMNRGHVSDQADVWDDITEKICCLGAPSPTSAMHDVYEQREKDLAEAREAFELPPETIGVAVYLGDRFLGFDLFDRAATFRHYWKSLLDSYLLDWLVSKTRPAGSGSEGGDPLPVDDLVGTLSAAPWERYESPGEGDDLRWEGESLTAAALAVGEDSVVHLQAFPKAEQ